MTQQQSDPEVGSPVIHAMTPSAVVAQAGTRLEQLHAEYATAKAAADEASARLKVVTDGIKAELVAAVPDTPRIELRAAPGADVVPLQLTYVESWRVDAKRLKAENPETYVRYAVKGGSWRLAPARGES